MDITRHPQKKPFYKRHWAALLTGAVIVLVLIAFQSFGSASYVADRDALIFGTVKRGDFLIQVRGVGTLVPKNIQLMSSTVDGRVDRIVVEAGARVEQGDVIAYLSNPRLQEQLGEMRWEIEAKAKENRAAEMALRSQLADLRAEARNAQLSYKSALLKLDAESSLVSQGIVSKLMYEQSKLAAEQAKERDRAQHQRVTHMEANLAALIDAHTARINKMQNTLNIIQQQVDALTVRARIDGILQEMPLKLGQEVVLGTQLAKIAPHDSLVAMLDIQDFQIRDVELDQPVVIDTRSSKITGKVARIAPAATNGVVKVEVALLGEMPPEVRPDLSIEGVIDIERKRNALFVERPSYAQSHSRAAVYRVDSSGDHASRVEVQLGRASTRHIEVLGGLKEGDQIIVSDSSAWESHREIAIR